MSEASVDNIATRLQSFNSWQGSDFFSSPKWTHQLRVPPGLPLSKYLQVLSGIKQPKHKGNHLPHLVLRLRMYGVIPLLANLPSWYAHRVNLQYN
jgi:hypothetical protein